MTPSREKELKEKAKLTAEAIARPGEYKHTTYKLGYYDWVFCFHRIYI